jgi:hypothetical protein
MGDRRVRVTNLPPYVSRLSRKCESLDVSEPYRPSRSITGIPLPFFFLLFFVWDMSDLYLLIIYRVIRRDREACTEKTVVWFL